MTMENRYAEPAVAQAKDTFKAAWVSEAPAPAAVKQAAAMPKDTASDARVSDNPAHS
jgi:hypothetical protein